jgi:glycosyltransferase involved in cell wall biosynthesis
MEQEIKVSIIIPIYNVELYLKECLDSAIKQTLQEIEIIAVNDGSTDNSTSILDLYKSTPRVTIINQTNQGLSAARNTGLRHAKGQYIFFLDSDDYIEPDTCKILYNKAIQYKSPLVICDLLLFWSNKKTRPYNHLNLDENKIYSPYDLYSLLLTGKLGCQVVNKLYKKEILDKYQCFFEEGKYYEDMVFTFSIMSHYSQIVFVNKPLYIYRMRDTSIVYTPSEKKINDLIQNCIRCIDIIKNNIKYTKQLESFIICFLTINKNYVLYLARKIKEKDYIETIIHQKIRIPLLQILVNKNIPIKEKIKYLRYNYLTF